MAVSRTVRLTGLEFSGVSMQKRPGAALHSIRRPGAADYHAGYEPTEGYAGAQA